VNGISGALSLSAGLGRVILEYDATTQRWRVISHEQGAWISPPFDSDDFTGSDSMTWTVDSGDVEGFSYCIRGNTMTVSFLLTSTSVGGTRNAELLLAIPNGNVAASVIASSISAIQAGVSLAGAFARVAPSATNISLFSPANVAWLAATNSTSIRGQIAFDLE